MFWGCEEARVYILEFLHPGSPLLPRVRHHQVLTEEGKEVCGQKVPLMSAMNTIIIVETTQSTPQYKQLQMQRTVYGSQCIAMS